MNSEHLGFDHICQDTIAGTLEEFGFHLAGSYSRLLGSCVEYTADDRSLFVIEEGGVVHMEVLLDQSEGPYRIDLVLAVWYRSNRPRPDSAESVSDQLRRLAKQVELKCSDLLVGDLSVRDDRFCFPFETRSRLDNHRRILTGDR